MVNVTIPSALEYLEEALSYVREEIRKLAAEGAVNINVVAFNVLLDEAHRGCQSVLREAAEDDSLDT